MCLEWPRVQHIDQYYREFFIITKHPKSGTMVESSISLPKAVMLIPMCVVMLDSICSFVSVFEGSNVDTHVCT